MRLKVLVGEGGHIMGPTAVFAAAGIAANITWPGAFRMGTGRTGLAIGIALLVVGVPLWITSVVQILVNVPRKKLITTGPFALVLHPLSSPREEKLLTTFFPKEYPAYRAKVLLPWL